MPDNTFTIGATVNVAELQAGMNAGAEAVQQSLDKMLVAFSEASPAAARAVARISDDTRAAAVSVDEGWQRMARATLVYNAALKEVSAASYLARKAGLDDAAAMNLLAAAKEKAAVASIELKAAEAAQAEAAEAAAAAIAEAEARAAAEAELSSNAIVAAFQRSALAIRETAVSIAETAEESGLSLEAMGGALEGMTGALVGGALIGGMFGHMAGEAAEFSLQMRNLGLITGISATTLAGLHDVVKEMGGDFDSVSIGLGKMLKAQQDAINGSAKQVDGFRMLGISVNDLKSLTPEELFFRIADGMEHVGSTAQKNTAAVDVFGKGGRSLIAVFDALGSTLRDHVEEEAKVSGVTEKSIADAAKYKEVVEELSVAWRSFATATIPVLMGAFAEIGAALEAFGMIGLNALNIIGAAAMSLLEGLKGIGFVIVDILSGNLSAIAGDARDAAKSVGDEWKGVGADIKKDWNEISQAMAHPLAGLGDIPQIPKRPEDLPGPKVDTNKELLTKWKDQYQAMKDAEDGFHDLSEADEARFWEGKIEIAKRDSHLYAEVYHEMRDAERREQKKSLKDEEDVVRERLASTKQGSIERLTILQEEVNHLKSIGADETEAYKRNLTELAAATRAYAEQQGKDAVEAERRKIDATRKGSQERVEAERAVLAELVTLHLTETSEYTAQLAKVTEAVRQADDERVKLQELDIEQTRITGLSRIQIQRQNVQTEFDLHRINAKQRIALLRELEDEEYEVLKTAIEKKLVLLEQDPTTSPVKIKELQNQIENLTREHNNKLASLSTQGAKESEQAFDNYFSRINSGFASSINGMLEGTKSFAQGMQQVWNSMVTGMIDQIAKIALKWIEQHLLMRAYSALFHTAEIAEHVGTEQGKTAATAAGTTQRGLIEDLAFAKHIARSAAEVAIHIAKELAKTAATIVHVAIREALEIAAHLRAALRLASEAAMGAFKAVMANVPFPADVILAPAAAAAAFAGVMAFASAAGGMDVTHDTFAQLHANEVVLPAPLSAGFKNIIGRMDGAQGSAGPAGGAGTSGASTVHHHHQYNVTVNAGANQREMLDMVESQLVPMIKAASRKGLLPST